METEQFDGLARTLAGVNSRRTVLGLAAALPMIGGLFAHVDLEQAEARGRRKRAGSRHHEDRQRDVSAAKKRKKRKKKCKPQPTATTCAGKCGQVTNNCKQVVNCGPCSCDPSCATCCQGVCCGGANARCHAQSGACCVPESTVKTCAGECGQVINNCGVSVKCDPCPCPGGCGEHGTCLVAAGACVCDPGYQTCSTKACATSLLTDPDNCGFCGSVCDSGTCQGGKCVCPGAEVQCGDHCTNLANDPQNCGNCGKVCDSGVCQNGQCGCSSGMLDCNGQCRPVANDPTNCGTCGNVCPGNGPHGQATCSSGMCNLTCDNGYAKCGNECVDLASDDDHCGTCGNACQNGQACVGGQCTCVPRTCGTGDCGVVPDGCGGTMTCSSLDCTCPAGGTLCDLQGDITGWKFCNGDQCVCAERADGSGNACYNPSAGPQCGSGEPICQTDADCVPFTGARGVCIKAGTCGICHQTACVAAC